MIRKLFRSLVIPAALSVLASGCLVATSRFEEKVAESDNLRDALAAASKDRTALAARNEALQKQLSDTKETAENCAIKARSQEAELSRLTGELSNAKRSYEGTRITREELITELMEKEKATGRRIQDLTGRAQTCDAECERLKKEIERTTREIAARDAQIAEIQERLKKAEGDDGLRRERDILLGRIERLTEDRKDELKRREARFEAAVGAIRAAAPAVSASASGPVLHVALPEKSVFKAGGQELSDAGKAAAAETAVTLAEFPEARAIVNAHPEGKAMKAVVSEIVDAGKAPAERVIAGTREKDGGVDLLVIVP